MSAARRGSGPWRLILPLLLALASVAATLHVQQFAADHARALAALEASQAAAARLAIARVQAQQADTPGFDALRAAHAVVPGVTTLLGQLPAAAALTLPMPDPSALRDAWRQAGDAAQAVLATADGVLALERDAQRLQSVATGLLVRSDELVDALIAAEAKPAQIRAAARQLMLVQRISTNLRRLLASDAGLLTAADRLGRDAVVFGEVATGLLHGNSALGIARVENGDAREVLASVGREFRVLAQAVEAVVGGGAARASLARRTQQLASALARLDLHNARLHRALEARAQDRLITPLHALELAALTALAVFAALLLGFAERLAGARAAAREAAATADAAHALERARAELARELEQLAADIQRIADGDLGLRAHSGSGASAATGIARAGLDRLRQQLRQHAEEGTRLARSGQLVGDVAGRLRDTVRRHVQHTEAAGQATRIMAAALDGLRLESAQVSEAARQSGASAQQAGHALGETLHELDAVRAGVEECAQRVRALEDVARELRAVRTLVEDVGELGKMLSLNVAIQASVDSAASRALGAFSDEVQRLATRARSAVAQVESIHDELRGEAERAASAVKESVWRARSAAERARGARASVDELSGAARRLEDLNHALARVQREHAVNVTEVVRTVTALHAITHEVREQVDATAQCTSGLLDAAAGLERRLAAPAAVEQAVPEPAWQPAIEWSPAATQDDAASDPQAPSAPDGDTPRQAVFGRWS